MKTLNDIINYLRQEGYDVEAMNSLQILNAYDERVKLRLRSLGYNLESRSKHEITQLIDSYNPKIYN